MPNPDPHAAMRAGVAVRPQVEVPEVPVAPPAIIYAQYQDDGLVRVHLDNDTQTSCPDDATTVAGQHLQDWKAAGNVIADVAPPAITFYDVDKERDRRNQRGQELFLKSGTVICIATATREDFDNINYASDTALTMIAKTIPAFRDSIIGQFYNDVDPRVPGTPTMRIRDFYRIEREVTYHEMAEISVRITDNIASVNQASHVLKDMSEIPQDYQDDKYWPTIPLPPNEP
jgi:hypothetical protein